MLNIIEGFYANKIFKQTTILNAFSNRIIELKARPTSTDD